MAQAVAERALRERVAEMGAESAEDEAELVVAIAVPVETAEHEEPAAGRDLPPHPRQVVGHRGEREFLSPHRRLIRVAAPQAAHRGVDLLECRRRQPDDLVVGLYEVLAKPDGPSTRTIRRLECHWHLLPSCRRSLCCIIFVPGLLGQPLVQRPWPATAFDVAVASLSPVFLDSHASRACRTCALYCETRASPGSLYCEDGDPHGPMVCRLRLHLHPVNGSPQQGVWTGRVSNKTCKISRSVSRRRHQRRACTNRRRQVAGEVGQASHDREQ